MNNAPLVAVITPVYNGAADLAETMDCVQAQSYPNLVHVVLDNASTDATPEILSRYADARTPVRVVRNATLLSQAENWNAAVRLTPDNAAYFYVLGADDVIAEDFIARTVAVAERHPNVALVGTLFHFNDNPPQADPWPLDREAFPGREALRAHLLGRGLIPASAVLIRRRELDRRDPFYVDYLQTNDLDVCLDILTRGDFGFVHADLNMTRMRSASIAEQVQAPYMAVQFEWLHRLKTYAHLAFDPAEAKALTLLYQRYYLRQLVRRALRGDRLFSVHLRGMRAAGIAPSLRDFFDALIDWPLAQLRLRPVWSGFPFATQTGS